MARRKLKAGLKAAKYDGDVVVGKHGCMWCGRKNEDVHKSYAYPGEWGVLFCVCGRVSMLLLKDMGKPVKRRAMHAMAGAQEKALAALVSKKAAPRKRRKLKA